MHQVFPTGHGRSHPLVMEAIRQQGIDVHQKPMKIDDLLSMVEEAA